MKHLDFSLFTFFALLIFSQPSFAQKPNAKQLPVRENYEWQGELPVYVEQLKQELTYPMAWGNSPIKNFAKWKKAARQKIFECMMTPPRRAKSWDMKVIAEEQRDGYRAQKISFCVNAYARITAYLLIPDGKGPFPAINALHDHGAHLYIGKEKMIRPFDVDTAVVADADAWAKKLYEGQYLGDYLARHG